MVDSLETRVNEVRTLKVLPELITHHLALRPDSPAVSQYSAAAQQWETLSFGELYEHSLQWSKAFVAAGLKKGDRVAMLLPNGIDAICFDQGALLIGLVPVPLHIIDTPSNCVYILRDSDCRFLVTPNKARWNAIEKAAGAGGLPLLETVVFTDDEETKTNSRPKLYSLADWLALGDNVGEIPAMPDEEDLACLVYTSGTTGKPKGVMLTHRNIMSDVSSLLYNIAPAPGDVWLSFLPLSHMFERTTTYYIGLGMGNHVYFSRGINRLVDDLKTVKPTIFMSVPWVFEKVHAKIEERLRSKSRIARLVFKAGVEAGWRRFAAAQKLPGETPPKLLDSLLDGFYEKFVRKNIQDQLGGRVRVSVTGGAPITAKVIKTFIGLGVPIIQGYGMTETSPIIAVNGIERNNPLTVGMILPGIEAKLGAKDELMVRGPQIMKGYWKRPEDTLKTIDPEGWLYTGDQARILEDRFLQITGRIKEIIVTTNGEKVPPVDIEQAIECDPLFAQAMILGDNRPFISALAVLNREEWERLAISLDVDPKDPSSLQSKTVRQALLRRMRAAAKDAPQYGIPRAVCATLEPWTIDNGCLTPTLKLKRRVLNEKFAEQIEQMYQNFGK